MFEMLESLAPLIDWFDAHPVESWLLAGGLAAVCAYAFWRYSQRQDQRAQAAADGLGFTPAQPDDQSGVALVEDLAMLPLLAVPATPRAGGRVSVGLVRRRVVPRGEELVFDIRRSSPGVAEHDSAGVETFRVAAFRRDSWAFPAFSAAPQGLLTLLASSIGSSLDIDVPDYPTFSKHYALRGEDIAGVVDVFAAGPAACLAETRDWYVEGRGQWLMTARKLHIGEGGQFAEFFRDASTIAGAFGPAIGPAR